MELNRLNPCLQYDACVLPVEYENGFLGGMECFEKSDPKPALVISMGEGDCRLRLETKAHNLNDTPRFADNAGVERENHVIEEGAAENELLTLPVPEMYCASQLELGSPPKSAVSISPGYYVCNDIAYRMARELKPRKVPFGFIHVPVANSCKVEPQEVANKINLMVLAAIRSLSVSTSVFASRFPVPWENIVGETLDKDLKAELFEMGKAVNSACRERVRHELRRQTEWERRRAKRQRGDIAGPGKK